MQCILSSIGLSCTSVYNYVKTHVQKNASAVIITTAHREKEKNKWAIKAAEQLKEIDFKEITFVDLDQQTEGNLPNADLIYICGGNTFYLLNSIHRHIGIDRFKQYIKNCQIYIGVSAGAAILGKDIQILENIKMDLNEVNLQQTQGLNFLSKEIIPHSDIFPMDPKILEDTDTFLCIPNNEGYLLNIENSTFKKITNEN